MADTATKDTPQTKATLKYLRTSAYKVREVLDLIRGQEVARAAEILEFCERGPAEAVGKVLASAVANAAHNDELDPEELYVAACFADEGKTQRRMRPRARGRATRIRKRSSHITIIVSRLPEERLARLRAKRAAEQAARRGRRGRAGGAPRRRRREAPAEAPAPELAATAPVEDVAEVEDVELEGEEIAAEEFAADEAAAEEEAEAAAEEAEAEEIAEEAALDEAAEGADTEGSAE